MKSYTLFLAVFICLFQIDLASAQTPTYDQTVNYLIKNIKGRNMYKGELDAYTRVRGYVVRNIKFDQSGRIEITTNQKNGINDFKITFNIFDLTSSLDYPDGVRAYKFLVHFKGLNVSSGYGITFATQNDAVKVARALRYYKSLCNESDDLFSNPIVKEKPTLTKSETLEYINNMLNKTEVKKDNSFYFYDIKLSDTGLLIHEKNDHYAGKKYNNQTINKWFFDFKDITSIQAREDKDHRRTHTVRLYFNKDIKKTVEIKPYYQYMTETRKSGSTKSSYSKSIWLPFVEYEPGAHKRLVKALNHLKDLVKEEYNKKLSDDPFGN